MVKPVSVYPNQQNISIQQPGCDWSATIEHELMHALGIYHEQSRPGKLGKTIFIIDRLVQIEMIMFSLMLKK